MVLLGGLEIVAAGYLLNEFNKDKVEARERRKRRDSRNSSRPPSGEYHRPSQSTNLAPPTQPIRPTSAPPGDMRPPMPYQQHQYQGLQDNSYSFQNQLQQWRPPNGPVYPQGQPSPQPQHHMGLPPGLAPSSPPPPYMRQQQFPSGPGPGTLQHAHTFHPPGQYGPPTQGQPPMQNAQTFPSTPPQNQRPPGNVYIDTKTGRIQHNLYPPDHPMAQPGVVLPPEAWGDLKQNRARSNSGLMWTARDENDLAYGKDYSDSRSRNEGRSFERSRRRSSGSR